MAVPDLTLPAGALAPWHAASAATTEESVLEAMRILIVDDQAFSIERALDEGAAGVHG